MLNIRIIGGYTQTEGRETGCFKLEEKLLATLDDYSPLSVRVRFSPWNDNWKDVAARLNALKEKYEADPFGLVVCAYSWGVGHGLVKLAKALTPYGITVDAAVTSDGIYRHWFSPGNWRVAIGDSRIHFPDNVMETTPFRQTQSIPAGRGIATTQQMFPTTTLRYSHELMDDAPEWHRKCIQVVKEKLAIFVPSKADVPINAPVTPATEKRISESQLDNREG
jgi:hypothetical protein